MLELMALPTEAGSVEGVQEAEILGPTVGSIAAGAAVVVAAATVEAERPPAATEAAVSELAAFSVFSFRY
jgi:hypothetical protein